MDKSRRYLHYLAGTRRRFHSSFRTTWRWRQRHSLVKASGGVVWWAASVSSQPLKLLVWNVRALNSPARRHAIFQVVAAANPSIVCFQETKMKVLHWRLFAIVSGINLKTFTTCRRWELVEASSLRGMRWWLNYRTLTSRTTRSRPWSSIMLLRIGD